MVKPLFMARCYCPVQPDSVSHDLRPLPNRSDRQRLGGITGVDQDQLARALQRSSTSKIHGCTEHCDQPSTQLDFWEETFLVTLRRPSGEGKAWVRSPRLLHAAVPAAQKSQEIKEPRSCGLLIVSLLLPTEGTVIAMCGRLGLRLTRKERIDFCELLADLHHA